MSQQSSKYGSFGAAHIAAERTAVRHSEFAAEWSAQFAADNSNGPTVVAAIVQSKSATNRATVRCSLEHAVGTTDFAAEHTVGSAYGSTFRESFGAAKLFSDGAANVSTDRSADGGAFESEQSAVVATFVSTDYSTEWATQ